MSVSDLTVPTISLTHTDLQFFVVNSPQSYQLVIKSISYCMMIIIGEQAAGLPPY